MTGVSIADDLATVVGPDGVRPGLLDRTAMAADASHYLLTPTVVAVPRDARDVAGVMRRCVERGEPLTFRSAGTSLSGQAGTDGVLVDVRRHFRRVEVLDAGGRVWCQPGATLRSVNALLAAHGTRLGPDPASEAAATVGGVVANNSSGMACGTVANAYRTLHSMTVVLPSGTVVDTGAPGADDLLRRQEPALWAGLLDLRDQVLADPDAVARITQQFSMKNTMGYSLNAFLDHTTAVEILAHLVVGSEGTLAFVADATFNTVPVEGYAATALLVLDGIAAAARALPALVAAGARTVELMDAAALRAVAHDPSAPVAVRGRDLHEQAALLVEVRGRTRAELDTALAALRAVLATLDLVAPADVTQDAAERAALWHLRRGLYTAVAAARPRGTTAILEDVVVPLAALTETVARLRGLFATHGYEHAVIFGHAKDGNLHFMITPRFDDPAELARYAAFTEDLVDLVLGQAGSLKAEHGTGRVMAPFVRRQYGDVLYAVMQRVKALCDPHGVLNPGVVLDEDPEAHLRHLKRVPAVDPAVDQCVECGYCEPVCPSRDLTTTPRQRIVLERAMAVAGAAERRELAVDFAYAGVDTCAADSLCATACPVAIDTGAVMKRRRAARHGPVVQAAAAFGARSWSPAVALFRTALAVVDVAPTPVARAASRLARAVIGADVVPLVGPDTPGAGPRRAAGHAPDPVAVFFSSCVGSLFAPAEPVAGARDRHDPGGAGAALLALCERAGVPVTSPGDVASLCCATPWESKGLTVGAAEMAGRTFEALWSASSGGQLPVVCDAASCTHGLMVLGARLSPEARTRFDRLTVLDAVTFVRQAVLPALPPARRSASVAVHPTCSTVHLGTGTDLEVLAAAVADEVYVPPSWGCCGFAGDRGMLHPELTAAATADEAREVRDRGAELHASCNRTCEMGMTRATGHTYRHILELLEEATR